MTLLRGNHTMKFGGNFRDTQWRDTSLDGAGTGGFLGLPRYTIASPTGDPAAVDLQRDDDAWRPECRSGERLRLVCADDRPSLAGADGTRRRSRRPFSISDTTYRENWTSSKFGGVFVQDSWRMTPNFTLNYGLRWELPARPTTTPATAVFPDYANLLGPSTALFQPGMLNGVAESDAQAREVRRRHRLGQPRAARSGLPGCRTSRAASWRRSSARGRTP